MPTHSRPDCDPWCEGCAPAAPKPVTGWHPQFDLDLATGIAGEQSVARALMLDTCTVEVKTDSHLGSGNLFVETHQKPPGQDWKPSGIHTSTADRWAFQFGHVIYVYPATLIRAAVTLLAPRKTLTYTGGDIHTKGVLVPILYLHQQQANLTG